MTPALATLFGAFNPFRFLVLQSSGFRQQLCTSAFGSIRYLSQAFVLFRWCCFNLACAALSVTQVPNAS